MCIVVDLRLRKGRAAEEEGGAGGRTDAVQVEQPEVGVEGAKMENEQPGNTGVLEEKSSAKSREPQSKRRGRKVPRYEGGI